MEDPAGHEWPEAVMIKCLQPAEDPHGVDMWTLGCVSLDVLCEQMRALFPASDGHAVDHLKACLQSPAWRAVVQAWHLPVDIHVLSCAKVTKCSVVPPFPGALTHPSLADGVACAADLLFENDPTRHELLALAFVSWVRFAQASPHAAARAQTSPDTALVVASVTVTRH